MGSDHRTALTGETLAALALAMAARDPHRPLPHALLNIIVNQIVPVAPSSLYQLQFSGGSNTRGYNPTKTADMHVMGAQVKAARLLAVME